MTTSALHAVTDDEADLLGRRHAAIEHMLGRYPAGGSRRAMHGSLRRIAVSFSGGSHDESTFPWELLCHEDYTALAWQAIADRYARATALKDAAALRALLKSLHCCGLLSYEQYDSARGFPTRGADLRDPAGRHLSDADMADLVAACGQGPRPTAIRDTALVLTLASTGARRTEIAAAELSHLHLAQSRLWLARTKGGTPRDAWIHPTAQLALHAWLDVRGPAEVALYVPLSRTGRPLTGRALSAHQTWRVLTVRAQAAGLGAVTPHDLRRWLISSLLPTTDLALISRIVGHKRVETTVAYDRRPDQWCRDAIANLAMPTAAIRAT